MNATHYPSPILGPMEGISAGNKQIEVSFKRPKTDKTFLTFIATDSEPLEKLAKIGERVFRILDIVGTQMSSQCYTFIGHLRNSITVFDSFKILGATKNLVSRDEKGKYLLLDDKKPWQKKADRVCLFAHSCFKTVKGLVTVGLAKYGALAKNAIGKLPLFTLLMDSFMVFSSGFGAWDGFNTLPTNLEDSAKSKNHLKKWEFRPAQIALLKYHDAMTLHEFASHYHTRKEEVSAEIASLKEKLQAPQKKGDSVASIEAKITKLEAKMEKIDRRLGYIKERSYQDLATDLAKAPISSKKRFWQISQYNASISMKNTLLGIVNSIGKIAVITFALTLTALAIQTVPFTISLLTLGIIVESIGFTKVTYKEFYEPIKLT